MFYLVVPVAAGAVAIATLVLYVRSLDSPEPVRGLRHQVLRVAGYTLLGLGVAASVAAAVVPGAGWLGWAAVPFAGLLVADGLLAAVRIELAGTLLLFCGALAAPLTAVSMLLTYFLDPFGFDRSETVPLALAVGLFTIPAMLTGGMFAAAGKAPPTPGIPLAARLGAAARR